MTALRDTEEFRLRLIAIIDLFRDNELLIRSQYQTPATSEASRGETGERNLLERATRRFLIDDVLRALGWNPDDPTRLSEEARSRTASGERLYFDYLGIAPVSRFPVILVEAKAFDTRAPRKPRGPELSALAMSSFLAEVVDSLKNPDITLRNKSEWGIWLSGLRDYVASLEGHERSTLRRVVIMSGRWAIIFEEPVTTLLGTGPANAGHIHCFTSLESILDRHIELFNFLHRSFLVDSLPVALDVSQALAMLDPRTISEIYRGVVVVTTPSGASRRPYPTRSVYPAVVVSSGGRMFAIADFETPEEEPRDAAGFPAFLARLDLRGAALERRIAAGFGMASFIPLQIEVFPGFPGHRTRPHSLLERTPSVLGLAAHPVGESAPRQLDLVTPAGDRSRQATEYILVTGTARFYKATEPAEALRIPPLEKRPSFPCRSASTARWVRSGVVH